MAITFPLSLAVFANSLRVESATFTCQTQRQVASLAGGEIISSEVAAALWEGEIALTAMSREDGSQLAALLTELEVPGRAFRIYDPARRYPALDPGGASIAGSSPVISAHTASTLTLGGMPNGYVISPGDYVSFTYGTDRRALHRFVEGATVSGGSTGALQVQPHVRGTVSGGTSCTLSSPWCFAVTVPGSVDFGSYSGTLVYGMSFKFRQVLRA